MVVYGLLGITGRERRFRFQSPVHAMGRCVRTYRVIQLEHPLKRLRPHPAERSRLKLDRSGEVDDTKG